MVVEDLVIASSRSQFIVSVLEPVSLDSTGSSTAVNIVTRGW